MAIIDSLEILSDEQVITGTCYSQRAKYVGNPKDWGMGGLPRYVNIYSKGAFSLGTNITFMIIGYNKEDDLSQAFVITQSPTFATADIKENTAISLLIPPVNRKYKYLAIKYVVTGGTDDEGELSENLCPVKPVINADEPKENCFTAFIAFIPETDVEYMYSNYDKDIL